MAIADTLPAGLEARRPAALVDRPPARPREQRPKVLVAGVVLGDQLNTAFDTDHRLRETQWFDVHQKWICIEATGGNEQCPRPSSIAFTTARLRPKYELLNELLGAIDLGPYEYVMLIDDDVILPYAFLDNFLELQTALRFAVAQPSRTASSFTDHPIVEQHPGLVARQTWFVEQGPVVSFHRAVVADVLPFDMRSPMGWGYENIWSAIVEQRGLQMGIVDAVAVDHSTRPTLANYSLHEAIRERDELLRLVAHRPIDECMYVVRAIRAMP